MDKKKIRKTLLKIAMMEEAHMEKVLHMMPEKLMMKMFHLLTIYRKLMN